MSNPTANSGIRGTAADIWERFGAAACRREGWDLFHHTCWQELEIEVIDEPGEDSELAARGITQPLLAGDDQALAHVVAQALGGSIPHALALYLEGRHPDAECWVPGSLLPSCDQESDRKGAGADEERVLVDNRIVGAALAAAHALEGAINRLHQAQTIEDARATIFAINGQLTVLLDSLDEIVPPLLHEPLRIGVHIGQYNPEYGINGRPEYPHDPPVPMTLRFEDAIRVVCGVAPPEDGLDAPSVLIERQTTGKWLIIVDSDGGDPLCHVTIPDQGVARVEDDCGRLLLSRPRSNVAERP